MKTKTRISTAGRISLVPSRNSGFTLVEVIVVVLVMSVGLSLLLGFNFKQQESIQLRTAGRETFTFLADCRDQAVLSGRSNRCLYNSEQGRLLSDLRNRTLSLPPGVSILDPSLSSSEEIEDGDGATEPSANGPETLENVVIQLAMFYADGSADAGTIWLSSGEKALAISMDPVLGEPKVADSFVPLSEALTR